MLPSSLHLPRSGISLARAGVFEPSRVSGADGRVQVDVEGEHVEGEDEGNGPFQHGTGVREAPEGAHCEGDGEDDEEGGDGGFESVSDAEFAVGFVEVFVEPAELGLS